MKIIISPAKKMRREEYVAPLHRPMFLKEAGELLSFLRSLSDSEKAKVWKVKGALLSSSLSSLSMLSLEDSGSPAIFSYDGIQYTYMSPSSFTDSMLEYAEKNLRIISGLYGLLRPLDGVGTYRLEMESPISFPGYSDLYSYWGGKIASSLMEDDRLLVNLASAEYSKAVLPYLPSTVTVVTPVFLDWEKGRYVSKGVYAKMERGEMVRFLAETGAETVEDIMKFSSRGYEFSRFLSDSNTLCFVRKDEEKA
ncbi:MAG: peroxide stress protein YaaA [Candidatus Ornithospirochaeta sp.]|nr:peroxide stress protein YaaA [Sphaerochaetaceae bacterium]MDY5523275.1 peroxide stress protein YaaA [Candidatus Ornithospirochaeta sp.]